MNKRTVYPGSQW